MVEHSKALVIMISVIFIAGAAVYLTNVEENTKGITAGEGREIADQLAKNWSTNATLVSVRKSGDMLSEGKFHGWFYQYFDSENVTIIIGEGTTNITKGIQILITDDGVTNITYGREVSMTPSLKWDIDSDVAYDNAITHPELANYLSTYSGVVVESFSLSDGGASYGNPTWYIHWEDYSAASASENYHKAWARIDAVTGEILDVEFQNG